MNRSRQIFNRRILVFIIVFYIVIGIASPVEAELYLTQEEKDYIGKGTVLKVASLDGVAPLHYTDSKGEIKGIGIRVLDEISDMTGLIFEYKLYQSIEEALENHFDMYLGATHPYAPDDMILSQPYLKSATILYINSSLDSNQLEDKIYAAVKGGKLPKGVKEENTIYFNNREDTLNAVENGEADYGFGNAYSVAFYTLQNGYENIVTIPKEKEAREYCMGFSKENKILLSIINKSIEAIDENQMQTLILDVTSHIDRKITLSMIINVYGKEIFSLILLVIGILLFSTVLNIRANNQLKLQNRRYELLSHISNECLFEYHIRSNHLELSEKCSEIFGVKEEVSELRSFLKDILFTKNLKGNTSIAKLPFANGEIGVFRVIYSSIYDDKGKLHSVIGKLIDISEEEAAKEKLISKSQLDGLTGLYNAITTKELITKCITNMASYKKDAFIIIDCDKFKHINDTFGHLKGDWVLENISKCLKLTFRQTDIIGRIGGDEFCVYMQNIPTVEFVRSKCQQLSTLIQETNQDLYILVSIGIAIWEEENTYEDLFKKADDALYLAKGKGGAQIVVYGEKQL